MTLANIDITTSSTSDARLLIFDEICNPRVLKEVISSIDMGLAINIYSTAFYQKNELTTSNNIIKKFLELNQTESHLPVFESLRDEELTSMCMQVSEKSLSREWDNEDDERWNKFLNE